MIHRPIHSRIPRTAGFTLIEVLITIVVLSIGLLGLAGLQLTGLKNNHTAYLRSQATILATDVLDRIRANRTTALAGGYDVAIGANPAQTSCEGVGACSPANIASYDLYEWKQALQNTLPSGDGSVVTDGATATATVTIQWDDSKGEQAPVQLVYETVL